MKTNVKSYDSGKKPPPPNNGDGGGDGEPNWGRPNPKGLPALEDFLKMPRDIQSRWYRAVALHRKRGHELFQLEALTRFTDAKLSRFELERIDAEADFSIGYLESHLESADKLIAHDSDVEVGHAVMWIYSCETESAWEAAVMLGICDDDLKNSEDGEAPSV
ncbi:hypothetical protein HGD87_05260 [Rhodobacteraceae bacterium R_SAG9]|nr:hypothetical protein [Rhodobacteraceae bacterium R_SAG9]